MGKTARGQQYAAAGVNAHGAALVRNQGAANPAVLQQQLLYRGFQPQRNVAVQQRTAQPGNQCRPQGQALVSLALQAGGNVQQIAQQQSQSQQVGARAHVLQTPTFHHGDVERQQQAVVMSKTDSLGSLPQLAHVERSTVHGAATLLGAGDVFVVIHIVGQGGVVHVTVLHHEAQHLLRALRVGLDAGVADTVTNQALEVGVAFLDAVLYLYLRLSVVTGNPDNTAGFGGGATVNRFFFHHQHRASQLVGYHGPGHAGGASTCHQPVDFQVKIFCGHAYPVKCHQCPVWQRMRARTSTRHKCTGSVQYSGHGG